MPVDDKLLHSPQRGSAQSSKIGFLVLLLPPPADATLPGPLVTELYYTERQKRERERESLHIDKEEKASVIIELKDVVVVVVGEEKRKRKKLCVPRT